MAEKKTNLFDIVPENFFGPLAAPGKIVYWDCISRLFAVMSGQLSFGVERSLLVDELEFYFDSAVSADIPEADKEAGEKVQSSRDKANFMLRKLESYGWIYTETDHSYVQRTNFRDYAVKIIQSLNSLSREEKTEYQGFIYTIYSLVRTNTNPGYGLMEIVRQTEGLMTSLKNLNSNIKIYIDNLTKHSTVAEILDALLNDYYSNVVDKAYHRLLTSDNVAKFRPEIISRLEKDSRSPKYMEAASKEVAERYEISEEEARERVLSMIHSVIGAFQQMDDIINEINQKNTKYQRAAISRARFLLTSADDIRGQLKNILGYLGEKAQTEGYDLNGIYELEECDRLIRIFSWAYLDIDSLYSPIEGRKEFVPEKLVLHQIDPKAREEKRLQMEEKLERILSPEKINEYVLSTLSGRKAMKASEFPMEGDGFIRIIYIRLYGQRKTMKYRIEKLGYTTSGGYRFRDFNILRK